MNRIMNQTAMAVIFAVTVAANGLFSQTTCTGGGCQYLPLTDNQLQAINDSIKDQYLREVMSDMSKAALLANLSTIPVGTINQNGFLMAGTGISAGYVPQRTINNVMIPDVGTFNDLPSAGVGVVPRIYLGVNAGRILGFEYNPLEDTSSPSFLSPLRFDIYITGFSYKYNIKPELKTDPVTSEVTPGNSGYARAASKGGEIRYHIFEAGHILSPLLKFNGLSAGAGFYQSEFEINYLQQSGNTAKLKMNLNNGSVLEWDGANNLIFLSKVQSIPLELRTGIQFLSFLNLTIGVGYAQNQGQSKVTLVRSGLVTVKNENLDSLLAELQAQLGGTVPAVPDAVLSMRIESEEKVPKSQSYAKAGIEFDIWKAKIAFEGIYVSKHAYGMHFGVRAEI